MSVLLSVLFSVLVGVLCLVISADTFRNLDFATTTRRQILHHFSELALGVMCKLLRRY
jgi:uncharacterized membrane protein